MQPRACMQVLDDSRRYNSDWMRAMTGNTARYCVQCSPKATLSGSPSTPRRTTHRRSKVKVSNDLWPAVVEPQPLIIVFAPPHSPRCQCFYPKTAVVRYANCHLHPTVCTALTKYTVLYCTVCTACSNLFNAEGDSTYPARL